ncbi:hypothetical protein E2C01_058209 [Portunus trituberculatus]|uniref:Uncharacterized protein n=1 Tax=Portunus trituberculatus TaxID=210409 RepID=A0A5B7H4N9_PORTR|nr:hypothetical protein [Portunus trituberculatus]
MKGESKKGEARIGRKGREDKGRRGTVEPCVLRDPRALQAHGFESCPRSECRLGFLTQGNGFLADAAVVQWNHVRFGIRGVSKRTGSNPVHSRSVGWDSSLWATVS